MIKMEKIAVYMGSFNPPHLGHIKVMDRMLELHDKIHVFVRYNEGVDLADAETKKGWFDTLSAERDGRVIVHIFRTDDMKGKTYTGNIFGHFLKYFEELLGSKIDEVWCGEDAAQLIEECREKFPETNFVINQRYTGECYNSTAIRNDLEGHKTWVPEYVYESLVQAAIDREQGSV